MRALQHYHDLPAERQAVLVARWHATGRLDYEVTLEAADQRRQRWTEEDDRYVLENLGVAARGAGLALGRTSFAVYCRRTRLKQLQLDTEEQP